MSLNDTKLDTGGEGEGEGEGELEVELAARPPRRPPPPPVIAATFAGQIFNRRPDHGSNESLGVWIERGSAYKIFASNGTFRRVRDDYNTAQAGGLPIGQPPPSVREGRVTVTRQNTLPRSSDGFAVVTPVFMGTPFQGASRFETAIQRQGITRRSHPSFASIHAACTRARDIGLRDTQGYILAGNNTPIIFIDIHVQAGSVQPGQDLLTKLNELPP